MIPKLIHQTSASKDISFEERQLQKRLRRILPDWELKLWDDADNAKLVLRTFPAYYSSYDRLRKGVAWTGVQNWQLNVAQAAESLLTGTAAERTSYYSP